MRKRICLESPFAANELHTQEENLDFARKCAEFIVRHGMNVIASHLLFPQFLDEEKPRDRELGIMLGYEWMMWCDEAWFFKRLGEAPSGGMKAALGMVINIGIPRKFFDVDVSKEEWRFISVQGEAREDVTEKDVRQLLSPEGPIMTVNPSWRPDGRNKN